MNHKAKQALIHKANGLQSKQIAAIEGVHRRTVETWLREARSELDAKNVYHAIAKAVRDGVILSSEIGCVVLLSWCCLFGGANIDVRRGPTTPTVSRAARRESII